MNVKLMDFCLAAVARGERQNKQFTKKTKEQAIEAIKELPQEQRSTGLLLEKHITYKLDSWRTKYIHYMTLAYKTSGCTLKADGSFEASPAI